MAITTPPLVPDKPVIDDTIHIVLNDFSPLGRAYVETDETKADEACDKTRCASGEV